MTRRPATLVGAEMLTGAALLLDPARLLAGLGLADSTAGARTAARLLGARQLTQALLLAIKPTTTDLELASAIDAAHCASMLVLARGSPRYHRAAITSAVIAASFCAWELWASSASSHPCIAGQPRRPD